MLHDVLQAIGGDISKHKISNFLVLAHSITLELEIWLMSNFLVFVKGVRTYTQLS